MGVHSKMTLLQLGTALIGRILQVQVLLTSRELTLGPVPVSRTFASALRIAATVVGAITAVKSRQWANNNELWGFNCIKHAHTGRGGGAVSRGLELAFAQSRHVCGRGRFRARRGTRHEESLLTLVAFLPTPEPLAVLVAVARAGSHGIAKTMARAILLYIKSR
jgi:hypothetical protein